METNQEDCKHEKTSVRIVFNNKKNKIQKTLVCDECGHVVFYPDESSSK